MLTVIALLIGCVQTPDRSGLEQTWVSEDALRPVRSLALTDHTGGPFRDTHLAGQWTVFAIGYTSCPDVCPTTLRALSAALDQLDSAVQPVFIGVDTAIDRVALPDYAPFFHEALLGVSGEPEAVQHAVDALGGSFSIRTDGAQRQVDHATSLFLVDPTGLVNGYALRPADPGVLAVDLNAAIAAWEPDVRMEGWIQPPPPNATSLAAYGRLINRSDRAITLEAIEGDDFAHAHAHETVVSEGVAEMKNASITVPAGGEFLLSPGGHHLMLMRPTRALMGGDTSVLRLRFSGDHDILVALPVGER